ncbi:ParB/RepB/Spo0J family partition protein [Leptolyngbya sp. PCC 6406]|uniref:ParB/RepB/Spo0J family partition protein n=1 Tax=Leptolyngbya sp. PCC 6406 TaxID=1173264 RepID=UPI0002ACC0BC|nr:ParB/RepB/Spo0J family partition protein [Leptolyngbya sp. PCC 6406]
MSKQSTNSTFNLAGRGILQGLVSQPGIPESPAQDQAAKFIPVDQIQPGACQPRQYFSESSIDSLAQSFQQQGFRGAINVRPLANGSYEIVAGERRWRAAKKAGLSEVRCIVDNYSDADALEFALLENLQREDLSKLEETEGILQLIEIKVGLDRDAAIALIGREGHSDRQSRSDVAPSAELQQIEAILSQLNIGLQTFRTKNLRTLRLPDDLKQAHLTGKLSYSAAFELDKIKDATLRDVLLQEALGNQLSFREIRDRVKTTAQPIHPVPSPPEPSLLDRLENNVKRAKKAKAFFERTQKRKRLERLLRDLESLLDESEAE